MKEQNKKILSLFDYSGNWSEPYLQAGYEVTRIDIKNGDDIRDFYLPGKIHGLLAAPPCTDFSGSGAPSWERKDITGQTKVSIDLVAHIFRLIYLLNPDFYAIENPVGRLYKWIGKANYIFNPYEFGGYLLPGERTHERYPANDAYTKKTCLWGKFNEPIKKEVTPIFIKDRTRGNNYSPIHYSISGNTSTGKELRSLTPKGFSRAFFESNP